MIKIQKFTFVWCGLIKIFVFNNCNVLQRIPLEKLFHCFFWSSSQFLGMHHLSASLIYCPMEFWAEKTQRQMRFKNCIVGVLNVGWMPANLYVKLSHFSVKHLDKKKYGFSNWMHFNKNGIRELSANYWVISFLLMIADAKCCYYSQQNQSSPN